MLAVAETSRQGNSESDSPDDSTTAVDATTIDLPTIYYPTQLTSGICEFDPSKRPKTFVDFGYTLFLTAEDCCNYW